MDHVGARHLGDGRTHFVVWAPETAEAELEIEGREAVRMRPGPRGYFDVRVEDAPPGTRYRYRLDGSGPFPDPASRFQPEGVHGPSEVTDPTFRWTDATWFGLPLRQYVIYELHTGTFTAEGTFDAVIAHLDDLAELGVTAVELMPVAEFPGGRNWGYDGVFPYAPQSTYGGPDGLRRLVDACHARGLAVVLDVVYNHLGPEGSYHREFAPYFTDRYETPWGQAINFDQEHSDEVRRYFAGNALYWFEDFHVDALRLDAVHAILDTSALPFLEELAIATSELSERLNRRLHLIAESADNDARIISPRELGGFGLHAQWNDDFHHALYSLVTGDREGYYGDYGTVRHLARAYQDGYVYQGEYSEYRKRSHGRSSRHRLARNFVAFTRNHDQIGNRMDGARLTTRIGFEELKLAAGALLLSPYVPLLFMGEEYGETAPFQYFVSHSDPDLVEAVRRGRKEEFAAFAWEGEPPDPQDPQTFERSKLDHSLANKGDHAVLRGFYRELLRLRRSVPALANLSRSELEVSVDEPNALLVVRRWASHDETITLFHFGPEPVTVPFPRISGTWEKVLDSADDLWSGPGGTAPDLLHAEEGAELTLQPLSFVLFRTEVSS